MPTKIWVPGEEMLAADVNSYVQQQVVSTFANAAARTAALAAPATGQASFLADTKAVEIYYGATLGWRPPWNTAWGIVKRTLWTATLAGIGGTASALPALATTYDQVAGRRYRHSFQMEVTPTVAGVTYLVSFEGAGGTLQRVRLTGSLSTTSAFTIAASVLEDAAASANVTRSFLAQLALGTGTLTFGGAATFPAFLAAEDVGPAV